MILNSVSAGVAVVVMAANGKASALAHCAHCGAELSANGATSEVLDRVDSFQKSHGPNQCKDKPQS